MRKIGISTGTGHGGTDEEAIEAIAQAGFDAYFTGWNKGCDLVSKRKFGDKCGLVYQSVHAPFGSVIKMWEDPVGGAAVRDELIDCLHDCAEADVPIMVIHPCIGMNKHTPTQLGIDMYAGVVSEAEKCGVKVAIENVEGIEYLIALRNAFVSSPAVGFCWDTGHEMCYNYSADVPLLFAGKLICTHLNDNLGMRDPDTMTWLDDSHLMPFDGRADWKGIAKRLARENFDGILTFELTSKSKPGRNTHDIYLSLDRLEFLKLAAKKARDFAEMCEMAQKH